MYFNTNKEGNAHFSAKTEKNIFNTNKIKAVKMFGITKKNVGLFQSDKVKGGDVLIIY